MNPAYEHC